MSTGNVRTGVIVNGAVVNVRKDFGLGSEVIDHLKEGTQVQIVADGPVDADSHKWYHVKYGQKEGFVRNDFIRETTPSQQHTQLKITYGSGTWFKAAPEDASQLGDELKLFIPNNSVYSILSKYTEEKVHYHFSLADGQILKGRNSWYVYKGHVAIT